MIKLLFATIGTIIIGASSCAGADLAAEPSDPPVSANEHKTETHAADISAVDGHTENGHANDGHGGDDPHHKNSPRPYDAAADGWADLNSTLAAAKQSGKPAIIVMGANWCHDSRGLAFHFENEVFRAEHLTPYFEQVYIDVGEKNRNIDIAQHLGVDNIVGTPTVFVVSPDGDVQNLETAPTWRNAASRSKDEIIAYFKAYR